MLVRNSIIFNFREEIDCVFKMVLRSSLGVSKWYKIFLYLEKMSFYLRFSGLKYVYRNVVVIKG